MPTIETVARQLMAAVPRKRAGSSAPRAVTGPAAGDHDAPPGHMLPQIRHTSTMQKGLPAGAVYGTALPKPGGPKFLATGQLLPPGVSFRQASRGGASGRRSVGDGEGFGGRRDGVVGSSSRGGGGMMEGLDAAADFYSGAVSSSMHGDPGRGTLGGSAAQQEVLGGQEWGAGRGALGLPDGGFGGGYGAFAQTPGDW